MFRLWHKHMPLHEILMLQPDAFCEGREMARGLSPTYFDFGPG